MALRAEPMQREISLSDSRTLSIESPDGRDSEPEPPGTPDRRRDGANTPIGRDGADTPVAPGRLEPEPPERNAAARSLAPDLQALLQERYPPIPLPDRRGRCPALSQPLLQAETVNLILILQYPELRELIVEDVLNFYTLGQVGNTCLSVHWGPFPPNVFLEL